MKIVRFLPSGLVFVCSMIIMQIAPAQQQKPTAVRASAVTSKTNSKAVCSDHACCKGAPSRLAVLASAARKNAKK